MRDSIVQRGKKLPETREEYIALGEAGRLTYLACVDCGQPHLGRCEGAAEWAETQISGLCGICFDALFAEGETVNGAI